MQISCKSNIVQLFAKIHNTTSTLKRFSENSFLLKIMNSLRKRTKVAQKNIILGVLSSKVLQITWIIKYYLHHNQNRALNLNNKKTDEQDKCIPS